MARCRKTRAVKKPCIRSRGSHRSFVALVDAAAMVAASTRLPCSRTSTRYPFSARRSAATLPPKPLPTTITS
jgi:hypothetical protein